MRYLASPVPISCISRLPHLPYLRPCGGSGFLHCAHSFELDGLMTGDGVWWLYSWESVVKTPTIIPTWTTPNQKPRSRSRRELGVTSEVGAAWWQRDQGCLAIVNFYLPAISYIYSDL
uniref:Uncharacterized protein n=1 Tax=Sphaerodactylus townsendi TaxID=933632 RepID=A0ACB8GB15_9SAUR